MADTATGGNLDHAKPVAVRIQTLGLRIDGDTIDTINVIPINWAAADPNDAASVFSPDFIGKPKHAEPSATITINGNATNNTLSESWVIDENGTVYVLVPESVY
ncbi:MAG: hypothetical protein CFH02_00482 [Alphaproteobacteria bacterium MarineAlpha3_Bin1]|nr:MAG: hypothetical protein CFH02_00482 [Alphaproteobacteria bacterium MarineAlpha3_Bin1]